MKLWTMTAGAIAATAMVLGAPLAASAAATTSGPASDGFAETDQYRNNMGQPALVRDSNLDAKAVQLAAQMGSTAQHRTLGCTENFAI